MMNETTHEMTMMSGNLMGCKACTFISDDLTYIADHAVSNQYEVKNVTHTRSAVLEIPEYVEEHSNELSTARPRFNGRSKNNLVPRNNGRR